MGKSSTLNVGAGTFVLLGFAALAFLTTQTTTHGVHFGRAGHFYTVTAEFDNVGDLKVGAPVSMSGADGNQNFIFAILLHHNGQGRPSREEANRRQK